VLGGHQLTRSVATEARPFGRASVVQGARVSMMASSVGLPPATSTRVIGISESKVLRKSEHIVALYHGSCARDTRVQLGNVYPRQHLPDL
jgi:hypothetical protein